MEPLIKQSQRFLDLIQNLSGYFFLRYYFVINSRYREHQLIFHQENLGISMTMNFSDTFLGQLIKTKKEANNTPIRDRMASTVGIKQGKENKSSFNNTFTSSSRETNNRNLLRKQNQKKKTLLHVCANHFEREGNFRIIIDEQSFIYCNKCAAHLASQGFQVQKIANSKDQQVEHPRKKELTQFLQNLKSLQGTYRHKLQVLAHINHSYQVQKTNSLNLYTSMLQYLEQMRDQHMRQVQRESIKNIQICEIQLGQIQETLQQICTMKEDIESNMQSIVDEVEQDNYKECMGYYNQKVGIYEHRLQQLGQDVYEPQPIREDQIEQKLQEFKNFIDGLIQPQQI